MAVYRVDKLMSEARRLAAEYRRETGKTLAISGEIALSDAIQILELTPAPEDAEGYDAVRERDGREDRIQVKARVMFDDTRRAPRLGQLRMEQSWDTLVLVLMDENYEAVEIYEAGREPIAAALAEVKPNRRGSLSVARLRRLGRLAWARDADAAG